MRTREIVLGLHFDQAAGGALKFELQSIAAVQRRRRRGRRYHDLESAVIEFVEGRNEAARGVLVGRGEYGDVRNEDRVVEAGELDVVVLAARPFEEFVELV